MARIWLDAGHSGVQAGSDPGAVKFIKEAAANLTVSLEAERLLTEAGHTVGMTRRSDASIISLNDRCKLANAFKADYFISIHHNAGGGDGYEIIHSIYHGKGLDLAKSISTEFNKLQNPHGTHGIYDKEGRNGDYFAVIRDTHMPAIITEFAYVDNAKDVQAIDSKEDLLLEAKAIVTGTLNYLKKLNEGSAKDSLKQAK